MRGDWGEESGSREGGKFTGLEVGKERVGSAIPKGVGTGTNRKKFATLHNISQLKKSTKRRE